jgi:hypothetical protein
MAQPSHNTNVRSIRQIIANQDEYRAAVVEVTGLANRTLSILTPDLELGVYDHEDFLDSLKRFVLARGFARVRVLISNPQRAMKTGNPFVEMGQRLNSYIEFRNLKVSLRDRDGAYCIADEGAIAYRARIDSWEGVTDTNAPAIARKYLSEFEQLWQASDAKRARV